MSCFPVCGFTSVTILMSSGAGVTDEGDASRAVKEHRKGAGGRCWQRGSIGGGLGVCVRERGYQRLKKGANLKL